MTRLNGNEIKDNHIFEILVKTFKHDIISIILLFIIDSILRLSISALIFYLLEAVSENSKTMAYVYAVIICGIWYADQLVKQNAFVKCYVLTSRIKSALAMLLYGKISSLTSYIIKSSQIGKITNLLSSDFGIIEARLANFLYSFNFPIFAIASTVLLIFRLGWPGVLGVLIVLLVVPFSAYISKYNGKLVAEINIYKDKRVQITSEVIEGIKFIKLYGWEIAFRKIIQRLREE